MKVRDLMLKRFKTLKPSDTYQKAVILLYKSKITGAPVVNENNELVGYVSEKDLFRILYPYYQSYYEHPENYTDGERREQKVQEIRLHPVEIFMTKAPLTVTPDMPVMNAGALMLANRVHQFPVVENNKVVGMISRELIYKSVLKKISKA